MGLCAVNTCIGLRYEVLDMQDATIDLLTESELSQAKSMGLDIRKVHSEYLPDAYHVAVPIWDTNLGVLFRVQGKTVTAIPFDDKGFYHSDSSNSELVFDVKRGKTIIPRVRAYAYLFDSKIYLNIRNQAHTRKLSTRGDQFYLYSLSESNRTYSKVCNTDWVTRCSYWVESYKKWVEYRKDIDEKVKSHGGKRGFSPFVREIDKWYYW